VIEGKKSLSPPSSTFLKLNRQWKVVGEEGEKGQKGRFLLFFDTLGRGKEGREGKGRESYDSLYPEYIDLNKEKKGELFFPFFLGRGEEKRAYSSTPS